MTVGHSPLIVLVLVLGAVAGCRERPLPPLAPAVAPRPRPPPAAERGFIGVVVAGEWADLEPRVEGRIEEVFVRPGDAVRRGQPIARLDVQAVEHELVGARAGLTEASRRLGRRVKLARGLTGVVSAEEVDVARRDVLQERARVARLIQARDDARLLAPFDGIVSERYVSAGALAGPGRPVARLVGRGEPRVRFAVPEERAGTVAVGSPLSVTLPAPGQPLRARVTGLGAEVDAASRMVYGAATLDVAARQDPRLITGVIARVSPGTD